MTHIFDSLAICKKCNRGVLITFSVYIDELYRSRGDLNLLFNQFSENGKLRMLPSFLSPKAPDHTPSNVADFFRQGVESLSGCYDAAGAMFRKTLEFALKDKFPNIEGHSLAERLNKAEKNGSLTSEMAEWAREIKRLGNIASHEDRFSEREATTLWKFTDLLLQYLFTLPGILDEARRESREQGNDK